MTIHAVSIRDRQRLTLCLVSLLVAASISPSRGLAAERPDIEKRQAELHEAIKSVNPAYKNGGTFRFKDGKLVSINLMRCKGVSDLSPLGQFELENVTSVTLYNATNIVDLSPLSDCQLNVLNLERCNKIKDLMPLKGMPLRWFRMYACSSVKDLSPLAGMPLEHLDVGLNPLIDDISVLKEMPLADLRIDNCPKITDISVINKMPLKFLSLFGNTGIKDYSPLATLKLETLYFDPKLLSKDEIQIVRNMKSLKKLATSWSQYRKEPSPKEFWELYDAGKLLPKAK